MQGFNFAAGTIKVTFRSSRALFRGQTEKTSMSIKFPARLLLIRLFIVRDTAMSYRRQLSALDPEYSQTILRVSFEFLHWSSLMPHVFAERSLPTLPAGIDDISDQINDHNEEVILHYSDCETRATKIWLEGPNCYDDPVYEQNINACTDLLDSLLADVRI
jgi:hypothetical protein